jgi:hypothetical protein
MLESGVAFSLHRLLAITDTSVLHFFVSHKSTILQLSTRDLQLDYYLIITERKDNGIYAQNEKSRPQKLSNRNISKHYEKGNLPSTLVAMLGKRLQIVKQRQRDRGKNNILVNIMATQRRFLRTRLSNAVLVLVRAQHARLGVSASCGCGHWPVVLGDAGPEHPDHDDGEQSEEGGEKTAVDGAVRAVADVHADHVLEDLADGEEKAGSGEVHYVTVRKCSYLVLEASKKLTHWANFAEHAED